jgi:lipopolysaccharide/colanic/teichoic acid biosynthesis glycosyltransferase
MLNRKFLLAGMVALFVTAAVTRKSRHSPNGVHEPLNHSVAHHDAKRVLDMVVASMALLALWPLFALIALAIRITSPGAVFYRATRVGQNGHLFKVYKFRSMVADADKRGPGITTACDSRVTSIGRLLRRTKLDELPQLINVLHGEMSLVGPRPEDPRYVAHYTPEQRLVLAVRPGITSPASVYYRDEESLLTGADWEKQYLEEIMPAKLAIDLDYARGATLWRDIDIIRRTVIALWAPLLNTR